MLNNQQIEYYQELIAKETGVLVTIENPCEFDIKIAEELLLFINSKNNIDIRRYNKKPKYTNLRAAFVFAVCKAFGNPKNHHKYIAKIINRDRTAIISIQKNIKNWYPIYDDFRNQCDETYNYLITLKNTENGKANQNN
jgi:hypothetical protein